LKLHNQLLAFSKLLYTVNGKKVNARFMRMEAGPVQEMLVTTLAQLNP